MWKLEDCAETAQLLSGLVAAVIILMLVVKLLWAGGERLWLILCSPEIQSLWAAHATTPSSSNVASATKLMSLQWA